MSRTQCFQPWNVLRGRTTVKWWRFKFHFTFSFFHSFSKLYWINLIFTMNERIRVDCGGCCRWEVSSSSSSSSCFLQQQLGRCCCRLQFAEGETMVQDESTGGSCSSSAWLQQLTGGKAAGAGTEPKERGNILHFIDFVDRLKWGALQARGSTSASSAELRRTTSPAAGAGRGN